MTYDALMEAFLATDDMVDLDNLIEAVREAQRAGKSHVTLETAAIGRIIDDIAVNRLEFAHHKDAWNAFCLERGHPEYCLSTPTPNGDQDEPF